MKKGRDILGEYGRDSNAPMASRASSGGVTSAKPLRYSPPQGPLGQMVERPGLDHTDGVGMTGESRSESGSVGTHGTNHGNSGTQGKH